MLTTILFIVFFGLAVGSAVSLVAQRNPLYSAISLIGVFVALAGLYVMLAAPFIAAVQIIVYAGAIMVLVVFVIMLLNVEEDVSPTRLNLRLLVPTGILLAAVLFAEAAFMLFFVNNAHTRTGPFMLNDPTLAGNPSNVGLTASIGQGLFTTYLLPFEVTSLLLLMALVGATTLARRVKALGPRDLVVPGAQVLPRQVLDPRRIGDASDVITHTTAEASRALGLDKVPHTREGE